MSTPTEPEIAMAPPLLGKTGSARVRIFIDYWNVQLTMNQLEAKSRGVGDYKFRFNWKGLGPWLAKKACETVSIQNYTFDGAIIYTSFNPNTEDGRGFRKWVNSWLNRQPGITVECFERKPKSPSKCTSCYKAILNCPECTKKIVATVEKGVDTLIATDMIRLAWEDGYDLAVIASSDSDLVPAVKFLSQKGRKVIQAGYPPLGVDLATACWASFDVFRDRNQIRRSDSPPSSSVPIVGS